MATTARLSPLVRLVALLCFASASLQLLLHCSAPALAGPVVAGASGPLPRMATGGGGDGSLGGSGSGLGSDASPDLWSWSYLDATPPPPSAGSSSAPFPFRLGVADVDPRDLRGQRFVPAARYGHSAVAVAGCMIVTHGYHYAMSSSGGGARWLSDTWSFDLRRRVWRRLHDHVRHPSAGPVARYAAVAVAVAGDLYLHGGDDGGNAAGRQSYTHAVYADLWRFVLTESAAAPLHTWQRVPAALSAVSVGPPAHLPAALPPDWPRDGLYRAQHAGALAPLGSGHELHALDSAAERTAAGGSSAAALAGPAPYWFVTHGLYTAPRATAGGSTSGSSSSSSLREEFDVHDADSTFVFSFRSRQWRLLRTANRPPPRFGHSLVYVPDDATQKLVAGADSESDRDLETDADPDAVPDQPRGALYLFGGLSRAGVNRGDLWVLPLQSSSESAVAGGLLDGGGDAAAAFVWRELRGVQAPGSPRGPWPAPRAYHGCAWTGDGRLHVFGGARCEPGCVCSAEYWLFDLRTQQWALAANSPHSPDSRRYPARTASGRAVGVGTAAAAAGAGSRRSPPSFGYTAADESVAAGWPVHRYKHSFVAVPLEVIQAEAEAETVSMAASVPASATAPSASSVQQQQQQQRWSFLVFGGESYNPSAYFQDVWRLDYTRQLRTDAPTQTEAAGDVEADADADAAAAAATKTNAAGAPTTATAPATASAALPLLSVARSQRVLETLLHATAFPHFSAVASSAPPPAGAFYRQEPPGGWGPYDLQAHRAGGGVLEWGGDEGGGSSQFGALRWLLSGGFWPSVLCGVLLSVVVVAAVASLCWSSCWPGSRPDAKKQF